MRGRSYRLYTNASDEALAGALQQVQPIEVGDLRGTRAYDQLKEAFEEGEPVPRLVMKLGKTEETESNASWGDSLDKSVVLVERVIAYWSHSLFRHRERSPSREGSLSEVYTLCRRGRVALNYGSHSTAMGQNLRELQPPISRVGSSICGVSAHVHHTSSQITAFEHRPPYAPGQDARGHLPNGTGSRKC